MNITPEARVRAYRRALARLIEAHNVELRRYQREEMVQARWETEKAVAETVEANR